jgi:hypothetical protein
MAEQAAELRWQRLTSEQRRAWAAAIAANVLVDRDSEAISVTGPCPTCSHDFTVVLTDKQILAELDNGNRRITTQPVETQQVDWTGPISFLAACHCDGDHENRPSIIAHGCGASGWLVDEP